MLVVSKEAYNKLKPRTKVELLEAVFADVLDFTERDEDFDWESRVDFSPSQITDFMSTLNDETKKALRVIAMSKGNVRATELDDTGIADYASFQRSTTRRTRTMTGNTDDFFLAWDNWPEADEGIGRYAVTPITHRSLRAYFELG